MIISMILKYCYLKWSPSADRPAALADAKPLSTRLMVTMYINFVHRHKILILLITTIVVFNLFYYSIKSLLLGMKCVSI